MSDNISQYLSTVSMETTLDAAAIGAGTCQIQDPPAVNRKVDDSVSAQETTCTVGVERGQAFECMSVCASATADIDADALKCDVRSDVPAEEIACIARDKSNQPAFYRKSSVD